jgi:quercetin dioxygenase-like cupin family protein
MDGSFWRRRGTEMKLLATGVMSLSLFALVRSQAGQAKVSSGDGAQTVEIMRNGSQASTRGPAEYFTGSVRIDPLFPARDPSRASGASVTFEPGARTAWHTHPAGQRLIVTAGLGSVQQWGGRIQEIRPGDVVWIPPGQKHWHGATPTTSVTHLAIQEQVDGKVRRDGGLPKFRSASVPDSAIFTHISARIRSTLETRAAWTLVATRVF